jgi:hypothetical protein
MMLEFEIISKAHMNTDGPTPFLFRVKNGLPFQHAAHGRSAESIIPVWLNTARREIERALSAATDNTGAGWRRPQGDILVESSWRFMILSIDCGSL